MKFLSTIALLILSTMALARPVTVPMDDASIDLAITLADKYSGTFSMSGDCAKNEFEITNYAQDYQLPVITMITPSASHNIVEEEREAVLSLFARLGVPMIDTGCPVKIGRVKITGAGCGDQMQQWSASFETLQ